MLMTALTREAISSRVVTVVQLRAVARTPSPVPASLVHIFERPTPSGCHAYSSRPIATSFSDGAAAAAIFATASGSGSPSQKLTW